jgi:hypothetical protein
MCANLGSTIIFRLYTKRSVGPLVICPVEWSSSTRFFFLKKEEEGRTGPVDAHARGDDETGRSATMRRACVSTYPLLTQ